MSEICHYILHITACTQFPTISLERFRKKIISRQIYSRTEKKRNETHWCTRLDECQRKSRKEEEKIKTSWESRKETEKKYKQLFNDQVWASIMDK